MKFSKLIALTLASLMVLLAFAACQPTNTDTESSTEEAGTTEPEVNTPEETSAPEEDVTTGEGEGETTGTPTTPGDDAALPKLPPFSVTLDADLTIADVTYEEITAWNEDMGEYEVIGMEEIKNWVPHNVDVTISYVSPKQFSIVANIPDFETAVSLVCADDTLYMDMGTGKIAVNVSDAGILALRDELKSTIPAEEAAEYGPMVDAIFDVAVKLLNETATEADITGLVEMLAPYIEESMETEEMDPNMTALMDAAKALMEKIATTGTATEEDLNTFAAAVSTYLETQGVTLSAKTLQDAVALVFEYASAETAPTTEEMLNDVVRLAYAIAGEINGVEATEEEITTTINALNTYLTGIVSLFDGVQVTDLIGYSETTDDNGNITIAITGLTDLAVEKYSALLDLSSQLAVDLGGDAMPPESKAEALEAIDVITADRLSMSFTAGSNILAASGSWVDDEGTTITEAVSITWTTEGVAVSAPADKDTYTVCSLVDLLMPGEDGDSSAA